MTVQVISSDPNLDDDDRLELVCGIDISYEAVEVGTWDTPRMGKIQEWRSIWKCLIATKV